MGQVSEKPAIAWSSVTTARHIIAVPSVDWGPAGKHHLRLCEKWERWGPPQTSYITSYGPDPRVLFSSKLEMHCLEHRPRGNPPMAEIPPPPPTLKTIHLQHFIITGQAENWRDMEKSRCTMKHEVAGYYRNPILIHKTIRPWKVIGQQSRTKC